MKPRFAFLCVCLGISLSDKSSAIDIVFDYTYDTQGMFTDPVTGAAIEERRAVLDYAASFYEGFSDSLSAIESSSSNSWSVSITHPSLSGGPVLIDSLDIAADSMRIYVGGSSSVIGTLGFAGTGYGLQASGTEEFEESVLNRGQGVGDHAPWGGYIWFNTIHDWHISTSETGLNSSGPDFLTTAVHEIGHILGFGIADTWHDKLDGDGNFTGAHSVSVFGDVVPTDQYRSHWAEGTESVYMGVAQETLMDPSTPFGVRQLLTELDYAAFSDIGWEVAPVPLHSSILYLLGGLGLLKSFRHGRRG